MGEFEELKKVGTKLSRAAEIELQKKQQQVQYEESQRKKQEEASRRRKDAETQKLLRQELERKKLEEERRRHEINAQLRAKEREREQEREKALREKVRKQRAAVNGPTYSSSRFKASEASTFGNTSRSSYESSKSAPKKQEYSFEHLQKMAQPNAGERLGAKTLNGSRDRGSAAERVNGSAASTSSSRQAAIDRLKVNRGFSPERSIAPSHSLYGSRIPKNGPVKRAIASRSGFPNFSHPGKSVNHVRDAGLKSMREGLIPLNTKKRDLRSIEEISSELREKDTRRMERERKMQAIEEEREKRMQKREGAISAAKYTRASMGDDAEETDRLHKEITGDSRSSQRYRSVSRTPSPRGRSPDQSPRRKLHDKSPQRRRRSVSPVKRRNYSPDSKKRSVSPRNRRSVSPPMKRRMSRDFGERDRERDRERNRGRDRDREVSAGALKSGKSKPSNGAAKRRVSHSPSPAPRKRTGSPRGNSRSGRGPFEEDMSVSSVIGALFGTRYRARAEDEDLSDDMEARADEVFREEARSARIARLEDEKEAELERAQAERSRRRKLEREKERERERNHMDNQDEPISTETATIVEAPLVTSNQIVQTNASDGTQIHTASSTDSISPEKDYTRSNTNTTGTSKDVQNNTIEGDHTQLHVFSTESAPEVTTITEAKNDSDNNDDFGDFGTTEPFTTASSNAGLGDFEGGDDGDAFGDFGETQVVDGDDDFGDFNDFAQGDDGFQDNGDFGDFEDAAAADDAFGNDAFGGPEPEAIKEQLVADDTPVAETAPDFNAVNSRQVESHVTHILATLYPIDDTSEETASSTQLVDENLDQLDTTSVLSDQELWVSLCEQSFKGGSNFSQNTLTRSVASAPQFQWKHSTLRKEYYASLGLVIMKEQNTVAPTSIPNAAANTASSKLKVSSPMIVNTDNIPERKPLDLEATRAYCQFTKENLGGYSGDEMKDIITRLTELTRQASDELTYWLDQREQMIMDSERYNEMIASLVGRAAKLKDAESKQNTKTKRLTRTSFHLK
ncbi:hypothetical protein BG011_005140 [Mortierella polycephala]|uniref:Uncharacterized protein n=1 Tax=Mortierella polycephala TaxID=41804 RepID=A0A9P6U9Q2_9FUNG|nr:hypothetical protein BG011_005140 [Mortierella polycephala]